MVKHYEFWLTYNSNKEKLQFPVNPTTITESDPTSNESAKVTGLGEITIINDKSLRVVEFSSFFPEDYGPYCSYRNIPNPWSAVEKIRKWKNSGNPVHLVITGASINFDATIEDFNITDGEQDVGDVSFTIQLKEYRHIAIRTITIKTIAKKKKPRPSSKQKSSSYTVKSGDCLYNIAKKPQIYGNSSKWTTIWNANKTMLIKRDKRNKSSPGHWIFPGQKLKIPR